MTPWSTTARSKLEDGDADGALAAFDKAEKQAPKDPRPHYLRRWRCRRRATPPAPRRSFATALALDPKLVEVRDELGALLIDRRR